jgi:beta-lactamase class A
VPTRTASPPRTADSSPTIQLGTELDELFGTGTSYSVAAVDLTTGHTARAGAGDSMVLASLVKLDILETLLYQRQLSGQPLTNGQQDDVERMVEHSDNGAADRLFRLIGGNSGMGGYNAVLGLHHTILNTDGLWGLSTTSADDQLLLLRALASAGSPLTATSRRSALALMADVESDQGWGVSAAADSGSDTPVKNGWLGVDDDDGLWAVNSGGIVQVSGHQVLMVVLSQHQPDFSTGVNRVQRAAVKLAAAL